MLEEQIYFFRFISQEVYSANIYLTRINNRSRFQRRICLVIKLLKYWHRYLSSYFVTLFKASLNCNHTSISFL